MTSDRKLQEFAQIFRCSIEQAPTYINRIHERMGHEVSMDNILSAMKKVAPKRLSMDTIVERLKKMERATAGTRARTTGAVDDTSEAEPAGGGTPKTRTPRKTAPASGQPSAITQIGRILAANWERGRQQGLKPSVLTAEKFVQRAQSLAGAPRPSVARVLEAVQKLDRRDVLLTPSLVADEINESEEA